MVVVHTLDAESLTQVGRAFFVSDLLGPIILFPVVGWHVEQTCILAVGHWVPVLATEEGRRNFDGFAAGFAFSYGWWALAFGFDWTTVLANPFGPGNIVYERETFFEIAVGAVNNVEEPIAIGVRCRFYGLPVLIVFKKHQLVIAGEVPGIVGCVLVEPFYFASRRVYAHLPGRVKVVVVGGVATG